MIKKVFVYHCLVFYDQIYLTCCVCDNIYSIKFSKQDSRISHILKVLKLFLIPQKGEYQIKLRVNGYIYDYKTNHRSFLTIQKKHCSKIRSLGISLAHSKEYKEIEFENYGESENIVISDIDDTILKSHATNYFSIILRTLFNQLSKRRTFSKTSEYYQELARDHKIIYLSNSTWNIYPLVKAFLYDFNFPSGQILLQNLRDKQIVHKEAALESICKMHPHSRLTLIGDEGQHDLKYYFDLAKKKPQQVQNIYIRMVWWKSKEDDQSYLQLADDLGINFKYFSNISELVSS